MSLPYSLHLQQFCSPLLSFFWFVPGFVEVDQIIQGLLRVWVSVTEFEAAAFKGFEKEWFCFSVMALLFVRNREVFLGL